LAEALISEVQFLNGNLQRVKGVSVWPKESEEEVRDRIRNKMAEVDEGDGIVILTDILGGTTTNLSMAFLRDERVEIVTGVNVPMLLTLLSYRKGRSLEEICSLVKKSGRRSITLIKEAMCLKRRPNGRSVKDKGMKH
jgi:PTS system mannose-specific IIA component